MNNIELLAPAGDMLSLKCAVYNGADAVYLGMGDFNARIKADNFTKENIAEVVRFAHLYNVKVYLTANTLIKDSEVNDFMQMIEVAYKANIDAFILQDLGMAMLVKKKYPNAVLHASTQMGIHNLQGAKMLQELGFSRVVLARETKLQDIIEIKKNTDLEIEYFVQGALCVAFSGNCYLSALNNGNSGNRGRCLQLCRLPYNAYKDGKLLGEKYYLSCKDLCLMTQLKTLAEAGVTSFKIEGRLKRASYVAQVVSSYRRVIDREITDRLLINAEQKKIQEIYSRGEFNENAYLYDNFNIINSKISNHEGKKIGKVLKVERFKDINKITLYLNESVATNDAIRLVKDKKITSIGVGNVNVLDNNTYEIFSTTRPEVGSAVYLLKSTEKEDKLTARIKKLPVVMYMCAKCGKKANLSISYNNRTVMVESDDVVSQAKTKPISYDDIYKQVSKLSETHFVLTALTIDTDNVFIPVSVVNDMRRKAVALLEDAIIEEYNKNMPQMIENKIILQIPKIVTNNTNSVIIDRVISDIDKDCNYIISPTEYSYNYIADVYNRLLRKGVKKDQIFINLPVVATTHETSKLEEIIGKFGCGVVVNNYGQVYLAKQYCVIAGLGMNIYNSYTAEVLIDLGFNDFVHSIESDNFTKSGIVYSSGHIPLMTLCHCPIREIIGGDCGQCKFSDKLVLEDGKGNRYKLRRYRIDHCYFELLSENEYSRNANGSKMLDLREI